MTSQNITIDHGHLLICDTSKLTSDSNPEITETIMQTEAKKNLIQFYSELFTMLRKQQGEDDQDRDYDKEPDELVLPKPILALPRALPIPKQKPLTRWEKYMKEKGIQKRKRSRMVYSELAGDWVPRWGKGSIKQIEKKANWAMEDDGSGIDPFTVKENKKLLAKTKQEKRELKNQINAMAENKVVPKKGKKLQKEINRLDEDKKQLSKRLEQVQKSTRSMGHFDKKLKNEKELNIIKKKKVSTDVLLNRKHERSRDKMIMESVLNKK